MSFAPLCADFDILGYVSIRATDPDTGDFSELYQGDFDSCPDDIRDRINRNPCATLYAISDYIDNRPAAVLVIELLPE